MRFHVTAELGAASEQTVRGHLFVHQPAARGPDRLHVQRRGPGRPQSHQVQVITTRHFARHCRSASAFRWRIRDVAALGTRFFSCPTPHGRWSYVVHVADSRVLTTNKIHAGLSPNVRETPRDGTCNYGPRFSSAAHRVFLNSVVFKPGAASRVSRSSEHYLLNN